jgi:molybdopterin converting factor small subunit
VNIIVRSYHELKPLTECLPDKGRMALADGETVGVVLQRLGVPQEKRAALVLFINGRMARLDTRLAEGDTLVFFSSIAGG